MIAKGLDMPQKRKPTKYTKLVETLSSDYFEAASKMHRSNCVMVYVEGYDDVSFWRGVLNQFETPERRFEISPPVRGDLAKGKKVVLNFGPQAGKNLLLCIDSDFDYLFGESNDQSRMVNHNPFVIQTYTYAVENLLCYPPSLHAIASKSVKNDTPIFDFVGFMAQYSRTIYPLFLWYAYAAKINRPGIFPLTEFRNAVRLNYLDLENNGQSTLEWLERQVFKKYSNLTSKYSSWAGAVQILERELRSKGVVDSETHLYMQGHTLMDAVVKVVLANVCEELRKLSVARIMASSRQGLSLHNELSYYNNSLQDSNILLEDNMLYQSCPQYLKLKADIEMVLNSDNEEIAPDIKREKVNWDS